ncbi:lipid A biosynthesis lauroyl acyltransferase [Arcobacter arenosus]|uniref:lipid A biosynthesis lauroyl acyltransferase n=1 Tax=Arcobacter arenosus TaxID=2576037 RepID=UPI003BAAE3FF
MLEKILYRLFLIFVKFMQILPKKLRRGFFFILSRVVYFFARGTNKIIKANLDLVFDKKLSNEEIKEIQKYSYFNMTLWVLSQIENLTITDEELKSDVEIEGVEIIKKLQEEGHPIIMISAHFGNMEVLGCYFNKFVSPMVQVARESNFKEIDKFITKSRESSGAKIIFRNGAVRNLVKALTKKEIVSIIIDQKINDKEGTKVDFLGKDANQSSTSALLQRKFQAYVIPFAIFNKDDYKYKIKIYDPIKPIKTDDDKDDIEKLAQLHANAISDIIRTDPKQWFWPHKRFKNYYKEIYEKNSNNK